MTRAQSLSELAEKLRRDLEELRRMAPAGAGVGEGRVEELLEEIDQGLNTVLQELLELRREGLMRVRVMTDVVPTEYSVMSYGVRELSPEENGGKAARAEVRVPKSVEAYRRLASIKKSWEEFRNRTVLAEILPQVYLVDEEGEKRLKEFWQRYVVEGLEDVQRRFNVTPNTRAEIRFWDIWMRRSDLRKLLENAVKELREKARRLREKLDEVGYRTKYKYKWLIGNIEWKISRLEKMLGEL